MKHQREDQPPPSSSSSSSTSPPAAKTEEIDAPLHLFGFEFEEITANKVSGRLPVTARCCQPFKVLHGGVSALIAESLASNGAQLACGLKRVAGVQLSINHVKSAAIGDVVVAEATPVSVGRTLQVWEVNTWKLEPSNTTNKILVSTSRVSVFCNITTAKDAKDANDGLRKYLRKYAKL